MADRPVQRDVLEGLLARMVRGGWEFDFYQAVWLLERFAGDGAGIGRRGPVSKEPVRFRPDASVSFPSTDVRRITRWKDPASGEAVYRVEQTFLGLYGVASPLPVHYAYHVGRSIEEAAPTRTIGDESTALPEDAETSPVRDFLDIFHHRLTSLYYRAWAKYRFDRTFPLPDHDRITD